MLYSVGFIKQYYVIQTSSHVKQLLVPIACLDVPQN